MAYVVVSLTIVGAILTGQALSGHLHWIAAGCLVCCIGWVALRKRQAAAKALLLGALALFLAGRTAQLVLPAATIHAFSDQQRLSVTGIAQWPKHTQKSVVVILDDVTVQPAQAGNTQPAVRVPGVMVMLPAHSSIAYGDQLRVTGKYQAAISEESGFGTYLLNHRLIGSMVYPEVEILEHGAGNRLIGWCWQLEQELERRAMKLLPQDQVGLLLGIVLGAQAALTEQMDQAFKATGTAHIVVASGFNIGILMAVSLKLRSRVGYSASIILAIGMILCYVLMSGASPSIIRASIMAGVGVLAVSFGRQKQALRSLIASAILMLAVNPLWLLDTSFQLSTAATAGIILFQQPIYLRISRWPTALAEVVSTSSAAQVLVWPILVCTFGSVSIISLLANILILWSVPIIMAAGFGVVIFSLVWMPLGQLVAWALQPLLWYVTQIIIWLGSLPYAAIELEAGWGWAAAYYAVILLIIYLRQLSRIDATPNKLHHYATA